MTKIATVLGSVRPNRQSEKVANFISQKVTALGGENTLVDFLKLPLPFFNSPVSPAGLQKKYPEENIQTWSTIAENADGFVLILPEYNHSFSAVIKNALDWLYFEFEHKPFALVGVSGGKLGGVRATEHIRQVIENFGGFALKETVLFGPVQEAFDEEEKLIVESYEKSTEKLLNKLLILAEHMKHFKKN